VFAVPWFGLGGSWFGRSSFPARLPVDEVPNNEHRTRNLER
jgi:hypothetical protein